MGLRRKKTADGPRLGPGALENQVFHLGDGNDGLGVGDPNGRGQIGVRIGVDGQHMAALGVEGADEQGGKRGLAHAAFAADSNFHDGLSFPRNDSVVSRLL